MRVRRLQNVSRGTWVLVAAIVVAFGSAASNIPSAIHGDHLRRRDRAAFSRWVASNGTRRAYGVAVYETHKHYDVVCAVHFPDVHHHHRPDYRIKLLLTHGSGPARVVRAVRGPLKVVPTDTGPKCGAQPAPPRAP